MLKTISFKDRSISGSVQLPASKSISNRLLILQALYGGFAIENLSEAEDTMLLKKALSGNDETIDVGAAGTAMRFLLAYYVTKGETKILTGSERMKERPIGSLVDALRKLGADINYLENDGYPPARINAAKLSGSKVSIPGNTSSQYISALLMIGPSLPYGLKVEITNGLVSEPYLEMTISLMKGLGFKVNRTSNSTIQVNSERKASPPIQIVEPDWSAASYWYAIAALSDNSDIFLHGLKLSSIQGDTIVHHWMKSLGVETIEEADGLLLKKKSIEKKPSNLDFLANPDLAQTIIVLCAALDIEATFTGLQTLRIKETDRIAALKIELKKFGKELVNEGETYSLSGKFQPSVQTIKTYQDHRMAMAFAPLALLCGEIKIEDAEVVNKSYPNFWEELEKLI